MPGLGLAFFAAIFILLAVDFMSYYLLQGNACCVSGVIGRLLGFDGNRFLASWLGAALSGGLLHSWAVRGSIRRAMSWIPGIDHQYVLRLRQFVRWLLRAIAFCVILLALLYFAQVYLEDGDFTLYQAPVSVLAIVLWSAWVSNSVAESWPEEARPLTVGEPRQIDGMFEGRLKVQPGTVVIELPIGGGARRELYPEAGAPVFKTGNVGWLCYRKGTVTDPTVLPDIQLGPFTVSLSRRWEFSAPDTDNLDLVDPGLLCNLEDALGGWADAQGTVEVRERCSNCEAQRAAENLVQLANALKGLNASHHTGDRQLLDAVISNLIDDRLGQLRGREYLTSVDDTANIAALLVRIDYVRLASVQTGATDTPATQIDLQGALMLADESHREQITEIVLSTNEKRRLQQIAELVEQHQLILHGRSTIPPELTAPPKRLETENLLAEECRLLANDGDPAEAFTSLVNNPAVYVRDDDGDQHTLASRFHSWQESRGMQHLPHREPKVTGFLEECGSQYRVVKR